MGGWQVVVLSAQDLLTFITDTRWNVVFYIFDIALISQSRTQPALYALFHDCAICKKHAHDDTPHTLESESCTSQREVHAHSTREPNRVRSGAVN